MPGPAEALVAVEELEGDLVEELEGEVEEDVGTEPVLEDLEELEVGLARAEEFVVLVYHYHANKDIAKGEETPGKYGKQECDHYGNLVKMGEYVGL